jgi:hypothetical protein
LQIKGLCVKRHQKRTQNEPVFGVKKPKKRPTEPRKGPTKLNLGFEKRGTGNGDLGQYAFSNHVAFPIPASLDLQFSGLAGYKEQRDGLSFA